MTSTEMAGGSPPADIDTCEGPDRLQTEISAMSMEMAGGSPPAAVREDSDVRQIDEDGYAGWHGNQNGNSRWKSSGRN